MANTFLTVQEIAREALLRLRENQVMARLVHTDHSNEFSTKGDTIKVRKPATFEAKDFTTTTAPQDITEGYVDVKLDRIADVSVDITSKEMTLNIQDFGFQVLDGAMHAIAQKIDEDLMGLYADIPYFYGTGGTTPSALADIVGVRKVLQDNKVPNAMRRLVVDTAAEAKFLTIDSFVEADKSGTTQALREANLGRLMGFDNYASQNVRDHTAGAYSALADVTATATAGATSITLTSAAGASTAKLSAGDVFQTADGQQFVVTEDTAAAVSGVVTAAVYPAVGSALSASAVTFGKSHTANLAFHRNAFAFVNRPMELPQGGAEGYVASFEGLSLRVTRGYSMASKVHQISFDILYGVKTLQPELAARLLG